MHVNYADDDDDVDALTMTKKTKIKTTQPHMKTKLIKYRYILSLTWSRFLQILIHFLYQAQSDIVSIFLNMLMDFTKNKTLIAFFLMRLIVPFLPFFSEYIDLLTTSTKRERENCIGGRVWKKTEFVWYGHKYWWHDMTWKRVIKNQTATTNRKLHLISAV